jgi:hypothetical protein
MYAFDQRQPGTFMIALIVGVVIVGLHLRFTMLADNLSLADYVDAALWTAEYLWAGLAICWLAYGLFGFVTAVFGVLAIVFASDKLRAWRVIWTVNTCLAIPPMLFLILTLAVWTAILQTLAKWIPQYQHALSQPFQWLFNTDRDNVQHFVNRLVTDAAPEVFYLGFLIFLFFMLLIAWSVLPAVVSEGIRPQQISVRNSRWLGACLSAGFRALVVACACASAMCLLGFPIVLMAAYVLPKDHFINRTFPHREAFLTWLAAGIIAVVSARGRFKALALGLRGVLDIVLDVANWLRYLPSKRNPRNRICARYASLLRYLCAWRDPDDHHGFDAIVILAHSQGCVITVDLLRFLQVEQKVRPDPALAKIACHNLPIYLFTMGNPLRQLYSWPLPDLYGWARHRNTIHDLPHDLPSTQEPRPGDLLGVVRWINAYRSGDYVGRYLWRADQCDYLYDLATTVSEDPAHSCRRREFCIGPGGHIHYWDDTAPEIAKELDNIIAGA